MNHAFLRPANLANVGIVAAVAIALLALLPVTGALTSAQAVTTTETDFVCPLDDKTFQTTVYMSFTWAGMRLDDRPIFLGSPSGFPFVPVCPDSGFTVYRSDFTDQELQIIRRIVETDGFKSERSVNSPWFMAAYVARKLGAYPLELGQHYLWASWEIEGTNPVLNERYVRLSLKEFEAALMDEEKLSERWWYAKALSANLRRRLGDFSGSLKHLREMEADLPPNGSALRAMMDQLKALAVKLDPAPTKRLD